MVSVIPTLLLLTDALPSLSPMPPPPPSPRPLLVFVCMPSIDNHCDLELVLKAPPWGSLPPPLPLTAPSPSLLSIDNRYDLELVLKALSLPVLPPPLSHRVLSSPQHWQSWSWAGSQSPLPPFPSFPPPPLSLSPRPLLLSSVLTIVILSWSSKPSLPSPPSLSPPFSSRPLLLSSALTIVVILSWSSKPIMSLSTMNRSRRQQPPMKW